MVGIDPHELAEERSLAMHRAIAEKIKCDPGIVRAARRRIEQRLVEHPNETYYTLAWAEVLGGPLEDLLALMEDEGERGRELRQSTPFAGALSPRERWAIWRDTKRQREVRRSSDNFLTPHRSFVFPTKLTCIHSKRPSEPI